MSRLGATFRRVIHEQVSAVRRVLDDETSWDQSEPLSLAELFDPAGGAERRVAQVGEIASLANEMQEALAQMGHLRSEQRQEVIAQCRVALDAEEDG